MAKNATSVARVSPEDLRQARKAGKVPSRPKKPKQSSSLTVLDNYLRRYNEWVKKVKAMASDGRRKETVKKKIAAI